MRKGSFFKEILKRSLFTMIVPLFTIIFISIQAGSVVKEQILLYHESVLNQFFELMDVNIDRAVQTIYAVAFKDDIKSYTLKAEERLAYQRLQLIEYLRGMVDEEVEDLFVYYKRDNRIISGVNGTQTSDMYRVLNFPDISELEFERMLSEDSVKPILCIMNNDKGEKTLYMTMKSGTSRNPNKDYVVVMVFKESFIPKMIESQFGNMGGTLLLFDDSKELLKSEDGSGEYHLMDYTGQEIPFETKIGDQSYMMQVRSSREMDIYYGFATSEEYFWEELEEIRWLCFLTGAVCVIISIILTYRNTKNSYRPVMDMIENVKKYGGQDFEPKKNSEFEFLKDFMKQNVDEKFVLSQKLIRNASICTERFLLSLISGQVEDLGKSDNVFDDNGIELCSNRFITVRLNIEESLKVELDLAFFIVNNVLAEMLLNEGVSYFARLNGNCGMMLINVRDGVVFDDYITILEQGRKYLQDRGGITITIAIGGIYEGIEGIRNSHNEAEQAEKYKFLFGVGRCICYADICDRVYMGSQEVESKLFNKVAGFLKDKNSKKDAESFVSEILQMYKISVQSSMMSVECFRYELFGVLHRVSVSKEKQSEESNEKLRELMRQNTLEIFCEKTAEFLKDLQEQEQEKEIGEDVCIKCKEYIDAEFKNPQLSVTGIGDVIGMYHEYLSKLFRRWYGISIPEYIAQVRIRNCKIELRESNKSISEIAQANGFANSSVFIRTFKKYEGITPGIYRDMA